MQTLKITFLVFLERAIHFLTIVWSLINKKMQHYFYETALNIQKLPKQDFKKY